MKYQLVLQWPSDSSVEDYDELIRTEQLLAQTLADDCEIDGHDIGSGEMNIFILTDDPEASFEHAQVVLNNRDLWPTIRVAYREITAEDYTVLWPKDLTRFQLK